jgi:outer membrane protein assembly factor BamB
MDIIYALDEKTGQIKWQFNTAYPDDLLTYLVYGVRIRDGSGYNRRGAEFGASILR